MSNGEGTRQQMYERLQEIDDRAPMTVYCIHCPKWKATGSAKVVRAKAETHLKKKHPELHERKSKVVRTKKIFSSAMTKEREAQIDEERRQRMRMLGLG